jgi:hypothetical protein
MQHERSAAPSRARHPAVLTAAAVALLLTGCRDTGSPVSPNAALASASFTVAADEHAAAAELARAVALALDDPGLRQRIKQDMRRSPNREHKLELSSYLHGNGGILLAKMAQQSGRSRQELMGLMTAVRPLEFYMPVPAHRASWSGGAELLLAWRLGEDEAPAGYTLGGERVALDPRTPPRTPTLVLVPVETDFTQPLPEADARNINDQNGETIGTMIVDPIVCVQSASPGEVTTMAEECPVDPGDGGGYVPPPPPPPPAGIYFKEMVIYDNNEPWTSGSPEIEVHFRGLKKGVVRNVTTVPPFVWPSMPSTPIPYGTPSIPYITSAGSTPFPNMPSTRFYPDEYEWVFADCAGAQAPDSYHRFDYNDEGGARHYDTRLFAAESKFTITEFVQTTNPVQLFRRVVPLLPPFEIYVVERDDGHECPVAERKYRFDASIEVNLTGGNILDIITIKNFGGEDIRYLLGGNNDPMARWWINSYAQLEALNYTWLPRRTDDTEIDDVIMKVSNQGFDDVRLPPQAGF